MSMIDIRRTAAPFALAGEVPRRVGAAILDGLVRGLRSAHRARLAALLRLTPDDKLAEIGVARSEIDAFARRLVEGA